MHCYFRCDANKDIGFGHFYRCLSLANALTTYGISCSFLMISPDINIKIKIEDSKHKLYELPTHFIFKQDDFIKSISLINNISPIKSKSLFIVDHYQITDLWLKTCKSYGYNIMRLSDNSEKIDHADIIWSITAPIHTNRLGTIKLYGCQYILLKQEFIEESLLKTKLTNKNHIKILISIGATDSKNTSEFFINTLLKINSPAKISLLTTSANPNLLILKKKYKDKINIIVDSSNVASIINKHHMLITAAGNTMWEAFCLSTPCLVIKSDINQQNNINFINNINDDIYLGNEDNLDEFFIIDKINNLLSNVQHLNKLSSQFHSLCDGKGSYRVAQIIYEQLQQ